MDCGGNALAAADGSIGICSRAAPSVENASIAVPLPRLLHNVHHRCNAKKPKNSERLTESMALPSNR